MSTLSEYKGDGNPTEASQQPALTKERIDGILQHFDVLSSRFDKIIFKYIYVYLLGLFFPSEVLLILFLLSLSPQLQVQAGGGILQRGFDVLFVVVVLLMIWLFNIWRVSASQTLRDLVEQKRIDLPDGDANASYLRFLENYRDALASPKRYFLSGFPMLILGIIYAAGLIGYLVVVHPNSLLTLLAVGAILLSASIYGGGLYCLGILTWTMYISGWYVRKLVRTFEFRIQPLNTDKCGGLKLLGNFCFGLVSPALLFSGFTIGYILLSLTTPGLDAVFVTVKVGFSLLLLLLYGFPVLVLACMLPLRDIHTKLVSARQANEDSYNTRIEALRQEIQSLLDSNQVEEAKIAQEKKAVLETLHTPYPSWPFNFRSKLFSTALGVSGSLLIGAITAVFQQYFLPSIFSFLFHHQ